jgi:hypothetical protein
MQLAQIGSELRIGSETIGEKCVNIAISKRIRGPQSQATGADEHARNERHEVQHHQNPLCCSSRYIAAMPKAAEIQSRKSSRSIERQNQARMVSPSFSISPHPTTEALKLQVL